MGLSIPLPELRKSYLGPFGVGVFVFVFAATRGLGGWYVGGISAFAGVAATIVWVLAERKKETPAMVLGVIAAGFVAVALLAAPKDASDVAQEEPPSVVGPSKDADAAAGVDEPPDVAVEAVTAEEWERHKGEALRLTVNERPAYWEPLVAGALKDTPSAWVEYERSLLDSEQYGPFFATAAQALDRFPSHGDIYGNVILDLTRAGNANADLPNFPDQMTALDVIERAKENEIVSSTFVGARGRYFEYHGSDPDQARADLEACLGRSLDNWWCRDFLGYWVLDRPGFRSQGTSILSEGLERDPSYSPAWGYLVYLVQSGGTREQFEQTFLEGMAATADPLGLADQYLKDWATGPQVDAVQQLDTTGWRAGNGECLLIIALANSGQTDDALQRLKDQRDRGNIGPSTEVLWKAKILLAATRSAEAREVLETYLVDGEDSGFELRKLLVRALDEEGTLLNEEGRLIEAKSLADSLAEFDVFVKPQMMSQLDYDRRVATLAPSSRSLTAYAKALRAQGDDGLAKNKAKSAVRFARTSGWGVNDINEALAEVARAAIATEDSAELLWVVETIETQELMSARSSVATVLAEMGKSDLADRLLTVSPSEVRVSEEKKLNRYPIDVLDAARIENTRGELRLDDDPAESYSRADEFYQRAIDAGYQLNRPQAELHIHAANASGQTDRALDLASEYVERWPDRKQFYEIRANLLEERGETVPAEEDRAYAETLSW